MRLRPARRRAWNSSKRSSAESGQPSQTSTRSSRSMTMPRSRPQERPISVADPGRRRPSTAFRSHTRTSSAPATFERPAVRACSTISSRPTTRPSCRGCARRASSWWARPIWTSSRWARRTRRVTTATSRTRGIAAARRAARRAVPPPPSRRGSFRPRPAPIPAGPFASRRRSVESPDSSRPTAVFRVTG